MKSNIALPPIHIAETRRFSVEADYALTEALRRYLAFYRQAYGAAVTESDLLREMARRFMAEDKEFQAFVHNSRRSRRRKSPSASSEGGPEEKPGLDLPAKRNPA